jgi:hypothetical protein
MIVLTNNKPRCCIGWDCDRRFFSRWFGKNVDKNEEDLLVVVGVWSCAWTDILEFWYCCVFLNFFPSYASVIRIETRLAVC